MQCPPAAVAIQDKRWCKTCLTNYKEPSAFTTMLWAERPGALVCGPTGCANCRQLDATAGVFGNGVTLPKTRGWGTQKQSSEKAKKASSKAAKLS